MAVTGQNIADKAQFILADVNVYWTAAEILTWINAGLKEICLLKPNALVTVASMQCAAGTKQTIPAAGLVLIEVERNMGAAGTTPGRTITPISKATLDALNPNWHTGPASTTVKHFIHDVRLPRTFYIYPPQPATGMGYIEVAYSAAPAALATIGTAIGLDDIYENVLVDYVCYRCFSKNSTDPANVAAAQAHYQSFAAALGAKVQAEAAIQPVMPSAGPAQVAK